MKTMRAARWHGTRDLRVEEVETPVAATGEIVIKVKRCGICGTDLHDYAEVPTKSIPVDNPHPLTGHKAPIIMGHEFAGDIAEIGDGVEGFKIGERVTVMPLHRCGKCYFCQRGLYHLCVIQAGTGLQWYWGGFADYCKVKSYNVYKMPDTMTYEQGALVEPTALAMYALDRGNMKPGDNVLIAGGGPTACFTMMCAQAAGAGAVYMTEIQPGRLKMLKDLGVTEAFNPTECNLDKELKERTDGVGPDIAIECTGSEGGINDCFHVLRKRGMYVQSGLSVGQVLVSPWEWALKDLNMCGLWCYNTYDFEKTIKMISTGKVAVEKLVTKVLTLEQIVDAFELLAFNKDGKEMKMQIDMEL
jgi:(R,R)-butanediol dehydrogenase/meso-butanediol dehydrogenase/diacetyl reductase